MDYKTKFGPSLKKASELLVLCEPGDLQGLCKVHTELQNLAELAAKDSISDWQAVANAAANIIQKVVLGEAPSPEEHLKIACSAVSALQLACENHDLKTIPLPAALGVNLKDFHAPKAPMKREVESAGDFASACVKSMADAITTDSGLVGDFIGEAAEHLEACDGNLLAIEANPEDMEAINAVFRAFHTIKGVSSFLNLTEIRTLAHQSENILDKARSGKIALQGDTLDLIFEAVDVMKAMIKDLKNALTTGKIHCTVSKYEELMTGLLKLSQNPAGEAAPPSPAKAPAAPPPTTTQFIFQNEIILSELSKFIDEMNEHIETSEKTMLALESAPGNPELLNELFRAFHTIKGGAGFLGLEPVERLAHKAESLLTKARDGVFKIEGAKADLCFSAIDALKKMAMALKESGASGKVTMPDVQALQERLAAACEERESAAPSAKPAASDLTQTMNLTALLQRSQFKETLKVDAEKLDKLIDTIGELVIAETMVVQSKELKGSDISPHLLQSLTQLDKITRELQEMGMALRMVPISGTFQKMARLVRDLSKKLGKEIEFSMAGEDTELDKNMVDNLSDPLVHMVRNAIDHGIEKSPEERVKAGKPAKGKVELRAFHKGGNINIEISDDGHGLDKDAIMRKALEKGLIQPGDELDEKEAFSLIFAPGFSTADKITEVSGRGVGMDVVKRNIEAMRGQIEIQSTAGKGSVFTMKLPLTLAIIDGMVVSVAGERYIIPTLSIVMSVCVKRSDLKTVQGRGRMLQLQKQLIPIFELAQLFNAKAAPEGLPNDEMLVVIVEDDGNRTGLAIDALLGQQQIVIKSLGDYLAEVEGIAGGAIMPDGNVGLILDVGGIVRMANA